MAAAAPSMPPLTGLRLLQFKMRTANRLQAMQIGTHNNNDKPECDIVPQLSVV